MHKLNSASNLIEDFGIEETQEKEDHNVYLKTSQWDFLDLIAERRNISRNKVLRDILDELMRG